MSNKILLVDDEPNVLAGYTRQLRKEFSITTAPSGEKGLEAIRQEGPFAVVVSDMRMPEMDGIQFLSQVKALDPDSIRVMLSGNADLETCMDAVNEGNVFRFLVKPCPPEKFAITLNGCLDQHRLQTLEDEIIHGTVAGTIELLCSVMGFVNAEASSRASRIRNYVRHIAAHLDTPYFWEYETAALLSQIGLLAMPLDILQRIGEGRSLTSQQRGAERGTVARHPAIGCELLAKIPRFEMIAQIIYLQGSAPRTPIVLSDSPTELEAVDFGGQLLRVSLDLDALIEDNASFIDALSNLHELYGPDHPMIEALMLFEKDAAIKTDMHVNARDLSTGMVAAEDIVSHSGQVVVAKGQAITESIKILLQNCAQIQGIKEPFLVEVETNT